MKHLLKISLLVLAFCSSVVYAARPTIAVLPFSVDKTLIISDGYTTLLSHYEGRTSFLTDEVINQLVHTRKFDVLERKGLDDLLNEKDLQNSDYADAAEVKKVASLIGAQYLVLGKLYNASLEHEEKSIPYSNRTIEQEHGLVEVALRIVEVKSGKIVASQRIKTDKTWKKNQYQQNAKVIDYMGELVAQSAQDIVNEVMDEVFPLKISGLTDKKIVLNRGTGINIKVGDIVEILKEGAAVIDQDTKEELDRVLTAVAKAKITKILPRITEAELLDGASESVFVGYRVRKTDEASNSDAKDELPPGPRW
jgi:curli biogenesis system outer membrane secretion channel CsgG